VSDDYAYGAGVFTNTNDRAKGHINKQQHHHQEAAGYQHWHVPIAHINAGDEPGFKILLLALPQAVLHLLKRAEECDDQQKGQQKGRKSKRGEPIIQQATD